ncbi:MAG: PHP domain-containing protein [Oscillospiraceae bacterium]|jgi:histidinol-phosphatase (PHP family)|nr:PHP domain-containing protein [Oscillospiraceae bacterium]
MFLADTHTHSNFSPDGRDSFSAMLAAAGRAGLDELTVTDHCDISKPAPFPAAERRAAFIKAAAGNRTGVKLLLGIELGEAIHDTARAEREIAAVPYDFIIGSHHELRGERDFYHLRYESEAECYQLLERYFTELTEFAAWGRFDVLGHLCYPLRYMSRFPVRILPRYEDEIRALFKALREGGKGIELNLSRLQPFGDVLALWRECGGEIVTIGSDAHRAADVGKHIKAGADILREAGFRYVAAFEQRRVRFEKI